MAEQELGAEAPQSADESEIVVPSQIDPATLAELFEDNSLNSAQNEPVTESAPEAVSQQPVEQVVQEEPVNQEVRMSPEQISQMQRETAQAVAQAMQQGQTQQQANKSVTDLLVEANPDVPRESLEWMVKANHTINEPLITNMQREIQQLKQMQQRQQNESTAKDYDNHITDLAEQQGITSEFEREALSAMTTKVGLEQHGSKFSKADATRIFKNLTTKMRQESHAQNEQYVEKKVADTSNAPPVTGSTSTSTGSADVAAKIREGLENPKDRTWDFRGDNFKNLITDYIKSTADKTLG
jgi:hypothetical protein|tara:strand:+ start:4762 stop:5655 length:894 start_codon:yes stop_codon:yes gene_type:complete